jgi:hypothetical protein
MSMKPLKSALALFAATGLVLSQPVAAASAARAPSPSAKSEHLAGTPRAAIPALIGILAVVIVAVIASSGGHHHPRSP